MTDPSNIPSSGDTTETAPAESEAVAPDSALNGGLYQETPDSPSDPASDSSSDSSQPEEPSQDDVDTEPVDTLDPTESAPDSSGSSSADDEAASEIPSDGGVATAADPDQEYRDLATSPENDDTPVFQQTVGETGVDPSLSDANASESLPDSSSSSTTSTSTQPEDGAASPASESSDAPNASQPPVNTDESSSSSATSGTDSPEPPSGGSAPGTTSPEPVDTATGETQGPDESTNSDIEASQRQFELDRTLGAIEEGEELPDVLELEPQGTAATPLSAVDGPLGWVNTATFRAQRAADGTIRVAVAGWIGPEALVFPTEAVYELKQLADKLIEEVEEASGAH